MTAPSRRAEYRGWGGVHPDYCKDATAGLPIETLPLPKRLLVSMAQHLGAPAKCLVKKGDTLSAGQPIGEAAGFVSAWIHAPAAGTVKSVEESLTVSGRLAPVVEIETAAEQPPQAVPPTEDWTAKDAKALVAAVARAGIVGMGGAGFPTHVKLSPPPGKTIDTLLINGAECEPYLTADHRLMVEQAGRIWGGAQILRRVLGVQKLYVAIEDNKPDAVEMMRAAMDGAGGDAAIVVLRTEYPQGAEKQLIFSVTGREVPSGGLPMDVGALVENVATAAAVYDAVVHGRPLTHRVITVTGAVRNPKNLLAPLGTPLRDLIDYCGGLTADSGKLICGGPMMGVALPSPDVGMAKTSSGLLVIPRDAVQEFTSMPCIGCARCVRACPMGLMPCTLSEYMEAEDYESAEADGVLDCIECGCCAFECPAHRPLVQHMKQGKTRVTQLRKAREARKKGA